MARSFVSEIEERLRPYHSGDERLGLLLSYCVGRLMLRTAKTGGDWRNIARGEDLRHIADWLKTAIVNENAWLKNVDEWERPKKLMKFSSIEDIIKEANKAMLKAAQRLGSVKLVEGDEELYAHLEDGSYLVRLKTPAALDRESAQMQHCIGNGAYDDELDNPDNLYLSLRDRHGKPHATLEVNSGILTQLQGKQNKVPLQKYLDQVIPLLAKRKWNINIPAYRIGTIMDINGRWHPLNDLLDGLTVNGDLDLRYTDITKLPDGMTVTGHLMLYHSSIKQLPEKLTVGGDLYLQYTSITRLSNKLTVGGNLYLQYSYVKTLPNGMEIGKNLYLEHTYITTLPNDLKVGGYIDLRDEPIISIPGSVPSETIV